MRDLNKKALKGLLCFLLRLALLLFLPAGTLDYWQAWIFLAVISTSTLAITLFLMKNDPLLLERRTRRAEKEKSQKTIQFFAMIAFISLLVIPVLDHRFAWSRVPFYFDLTGDLLIALGFLIIFFVFKANSFTSAIIEVDTEQKVISTGPYALVRHPMYLGALVMLIGIPLALGSWWGLLTFLPITAVICWRLLDEERFLHQNLPGYAEYQHHVRYRLVPFLW